MRMLVTKARRFGMYRREVLPNGVRVVTEEIPYVHSAAIGIWVRAGSRYEEAIKSGISHFIEHLLFKGTPKRTARDIAEQLESVGGVLNAFTTKEYTCFYAKVLSEHLELAIDVLGDMYFNSLFDPEEIEKEKNVITEEIRLYEDSPDELVHDLLARTIWNGHPLGRAILGTAESVAGLSRADLLDYRRRYYQGENVVIAAAGNIRHAEVLDKLQVFASDELRPGPAETLAPPNPHADVMITTKDTEQVQLCLGMPGLAQEDERIYALQALNNVLGGGLSSRLFQEVRENRGLAYSVYSYHSAYLDSGLFTVYAGTKPANFRVVLQVLLDELEKIKVAGITEEELQRSKEQTRGNLLLGLENVSNRMSRLGKTELAFDRVVTVDEVLEKVAKVTVSEVRDVATRMFDREKLALTAIGPLDQGVDGEKILSEAKL